ncbi:hypothetical protein ACFCW2_04155 [Qipengyuania sp. DSG2-2]|uniref:hypothetical protein n=1 Tax=Qipengyuania sp. DGS2-2 TaxID=3349631 RepID=UPI0036D2B5FB
MNGLSGGKDERQRLIEDALALVRSEGRVITRADLALSGGLSRSKIERHFPEEADLFDCVAEAFYQPQIDLMEQVVASDLSPPRKMYEFFARRYLLNREDFRADPSGYRALCEVGSEEFERVRGYVDLADHYLAMIVAEAQGDGAFPDLTIDQALSLINQMVMCYTMPDLIALLDHRLSEGKLAQIIDTLFAGLAGTDRGAAPVTGLRAAT